MRPLYCKSFVSPECYSRCTIKNTCHVTMSETAVDLKNGVVLGFLEEAARWQLLSAQFPSKVGGKPAWLSQQSLPTPSELLCEKCQISTVFLLQVYAPIVAFDRCFHRTVYIFCCKTPTCYTSNDGRCFKGDCVHISRACDASSG